MRDWVERAFGGDVGKEKGIQWGAVTTSEQLGYPSGASGSHSRQSLRSKRSSSVI